MEDRFESAELMAAARGAAAGAYAPYSGFSVGAVIVAESGNHYVGVNVENASYGTSICAERVALALAVSTGERGFTVLAVASADGDDAPPCGACRQALAEFSPSMSIIYVSGGKTVIRSLEELLPDAFGIQGHR